MLKYIWMVTQDLFVAVTIVTLIHELLRTRFEKHFLRIHWAGILLGGCSAIALALVKYNTNKIVSSRWNHSIYLFLVGFTLVFVLFALLFTRDGKEKRGAGAMLTSFFAACLSATWIFYALPASAAYPFIFNTMGNGYLSWYYLQRVLGWIIGFVLLMLYSFLLASCVRQLRKQSLALMVLLTDALVNAYYCVCRFFVPWVNRAKWLNWPVKYDRDVHGWAMDMFKFSTRHAMTFIWVTVVLSLVLLVVFFIENLHIIDPYDNPAELRKLKARGKRRRRQSVFLLIFLTLITAAITVVKSYDTREVVLSTPESYTIEEDRILVPIDSVNDEHLHRFEYQTQNDVFVRWIVVKKPGSASFGVGLDACEVCGNAGYYERNGQIICKRCDVVMNTNTIGFKGGCNPIPLAYEVEDGSLVFAIADLVAGEKEFK